MEAGFPSWSALIERMCAEVEDEDLRQAALLDSTDVMRKVEYIDRLARPKTRKEVVRRALYRDNPESLPGTLADALARLALMAPRDILLATTNFDSQLERALENRGAELTVQPRSLSDEDFAEWRNQATGSISVLHLHGYLDESSESKDVGELVLSEADFLTHGGAVRERLEILLSECDSIFVGVSMGDPNLIAPLNSLSGSRETRSFLLAAPEHISGLDADTVSAYFDQRASYLKEQLSVESIYLNSYAQASQLVYELGLAHRSARRYLSDSRSHSIRYGHRFRRRITAAYKAVGGRRGCVPPVGESQRGVSDKLHAMMSSSGVIGAALKAARSELAEGAKKAYGISETYLEQEQLACFLWLRAVTDSPDEAAPYQLRLIASSAYSHREAWTQDDEAFIAPDSPFPVAKAVFFGNARVEPAQRAGNAIWNCIFAMPLSVQGDDDSDLLTIGAVSLNSRRNYFTPEELVDLKKKRREEARDVEGTDRPSLLTLLPATSVREIQLAIADEMAKVLSPA